VETGIVVSVLALGVLIAASVDLPLAASSAIVGLRDLSRAAHGAEMPAGVSGLAYGVGFVIATAFLLACGIGLGIAVQRLASPAVVRFAGIAMVLCGGYLWLS